MITHVIVKLDAPIEEKYWEDDDIFSNEYYGLGKPLIRCKDCKYQEKYFHKDGRRKVGGYYIYGCELAEGYSHVCLDDDYCSRAERKEE